VPYFENVLTIYIRLAAYFQSVYRWNIRKQPSEINDPWNIANTAFVMWVLVLFLVLLGWMIGILFTPCEWIGSDSNDLAGYFLVAFGSSILFSSILTPLLFFKSKRLRQRLDQVNKLGAKVSVIAFYLRLVLTVTLFLAFTFVLISLVRHNCGLSIFAENAI
jgi:hypothetical protein